MPVDMEDMESLLGALERRVERLEELLPPEMQRDAAFDVEAAEEAKAQAVDDTVMGLSPTGRAPSAPICQDLNHGEKPGEVSLTELDYSTVERRVMAGLAAGTIEPLPGAPEPPLSELRGTGEEGDEFQPLRDLVAELKAKGEWPPGYTKLSPKGIAERILGTKPELYGCLPVSTAHITKVDRDTLEEMDLSDNCQMVMGRETGYFVKLYEEDDPDENLNLYPGLSLECNAIFKLAYDLGCRMVEFDCDAPRYPGLPEFEWRLMDDEELEDDYDEEEPDLSEDEDEEPCWIEEDGYPQIKATMKVPESYDDFHELLFGDCGDFPRWLPGVETWSCVARIAFEHGKRARRDHAEPHVCEACGSTCDDSSCCVNAA